MANDLDLTDEEVVNARRLAFDPLCLEEMEPVSFRDCRGDRWAGLFLGFVVGERDGDYLLENIVLQDATRNGAPCPGIAPCIRKATEFRRESPRFALLAWQLFVGSPSPGRA